MPEKTALLNGLGVLLQYALIVLMYYFLYQILRLMRADLGFNFPALISRVPAKLTILHAEGAAPKQRVFPVRGRLLIGRGPENAIVIDDTYVSHEHAVIWQDDGGYWIEDLNSINHTYLNDIILEAKTSLASGDMIKVGLVTFKFER